MPVLGIEPARERGPTSPSRGTASRPGRSSSRADTAARLAAEGLRADVFHAHNVLAHVPDLNGFVAGIRTC